MICFVIVIFPGFFTHMFQTVLEKTFSTLSYINVLRKTLNGFCCKKANANLFDRTSKKKNMVEFPYSILQKIFSCKAFFHFFANPGPLNLAGSGIRRRIRVNIAIVLLNHARCFLLFFV